MCWKLFIDFSFECWDLLTYRSLSASFRALSGPTMKPKILPNRQWKCFHLGNTNKQLMFGHWQNDGPTFSRLFLFRQLQMAICARLSTYAVTEDSEGHRKLLWVRQGRIAPKLCAVWCVKTVGRWWWCCCPHVTFGSLFVQGAPTCEKPGATML